MPSRREEMPALQLLTPCLRWERGFLCCRCPLVRQDTGRRNHTVVKPGRRVSVPILNVMGGAATDFQAVRRRELHGGRVEAGTSYLRRQRSLRERRELPDLRAVLQRPACNPFLRADAKYWNKLTAEEKKKEADTVFRVGSGVALDAKVARTLLNAHAIGCSKCSAAPVLGGSARRSWCGIR